MKKNTDIDELVKPPILEETGGNRIAKIFILLITVIVITFIIWASFAQIDEISMTSGKIIPMMRVQKIQHLKGGIIEHIYVRNGDLVTKGQKLLQLESDTPRSYQKETEAQVKSYMARRNRLQAVIKGENPDFQELGTNNKDLASAELAVYNTVIYAAELDKKLLLSQINQAKSQLKEQKLQQKALLNQMKYLNEELQINEKLYLKNVIAKIVLLKIRRQKSDLNEELLPISEQIIKTNKQINGMKVQLAQVTANLYKQAILELEDINHELLKLIESEKRYSLEIKRSSIRSNIEGYVHNLSKFSVGGVVESNELIMEIVPKERKLVAKVDIAPKDIGHVKIGLTAYLKFTAYDFGRYGSIKGTLQKIAHTSTESLDKPGFPTYEGIISLSQDYIGTGKMKKNIKPGMSLTADIKTGQKTLVEYLLKPVFVSAKHAMRER
jgi:membrane fusion protein, adhesin transport system